MSVATGPMSQSDFLEWEARQEARFEFDSFAPRAMTGGSQAHDRIRGNIFASLHRQLKGRPCRPTIDVRVVCPNGAVRYPDVAVDCGGFVPSGLDLVDPRLVVEVLSPSTQAVDYILKAADYGSVAGIAAYLIVDPNRTFVDLLLREDAKLRPAANVQSESDVVSIEALGVSLTLAEIYEG
jgi:Uma2 family endonuclease